MMAVVLATIGLGLAGFDPLGLAVLLAAAGLGISRRGIAVLTAVSLVTGSVLGLVFSFGLGAAVPRITRLLFGPGQAIERHVHSHHARYVWGALLVLAGLGLLAWGLRRLARGPAPPRPAAYGRLATTRTPALAVAGLGVGASALLDPAFYAMAVFAGHLHHPVARIGVVLGWTLLSQVGLVIGALALISGHSGGFRARLDGLWARYHRLGSRLVPIALLALGALGVGLGVLELGGVELGHR